MASGEKWTLGKKRELFTEVGKRMKNPFLKKIIACGGALFLLEEGGEGINDTTYIYNIFITVKHESLPQFTYVSRFKCFRKRSIFDLLNSKRRRISVQEFQVYSCVCVLP